MKEEPYTVIEPRRNWSLINIRELIHYRELLYFLTWRDIKVRYRQAVLGAAWAILQPILYMVVFSIFLGKLVKMPSEGIPYSIFVFAGLLPWLFFSNAVSSAGQSLVGSSHLITKVYFPRIFIPTAKIVTTLLDFMVSTLVIFIMLPFYDMALTWNIFLLLVLIFLTLLCAIGVGSFLSALNVEYRDFQYVTPFMIQIWMFCSPVVYPVSIVPERWRWVLTLNPMTGIIDGYRAAFLGKAIDWEGLGISGVTVVLIFIIGLSYFMKVEERFADII